MRKQYISPTTQVIVLDNLCNSLNSISIVNGANNTTEETSDVYEDDDNQIFNVDNWGGD